MQLLLRKEILRKVQHPEIQFILLTTIKVDGVGLNLVTATAAIFMDLQWNLAVKLQARDWLHRIGQTQPVTIYRMVTDLTIDTYIQNSQNCKKTQTTALLFGTQITTTNTVNSVPNFRNCSKYFKPNTRSRISLIGKLRHWFREFRVISSACSTLLVLRVPWTCTAAVPRCTAICSAYTYRSCTTSLVSHVRIISFACSALSTI